MAKISDPLVQELLHSRRVACLGTVSADESVHLTSVWFLFEGDSLYVATSSRTHKARNLQARPRASLMIDSRDPAASYGVTLSGAARILTGDAAHGWNARIHERYLSRAALADARVGPVFATWDDITVQLSPASVFTWDMRELDKTALGGVIAARPDYLLPLER